MLIQTFLLLNTKEDILKNVGNQKVDGSLLTSIVGKRKYYGRFHPSFPSDFRDKLWVSLDLSGYGNDKNFGQECNSRINMKCICKIRTCF